MAQSRTGSRNRGLSRSRRSVQQNSSGQRAGERFVLLHIIEFDRSDLPMQARLDDGLNELGFQRLAASDRLENVVKHVDCAKIRRDSPRRNRVLQNRAVAAVFLNRLEQAEGAATRRILCGCAAIHCGFDARVEIAPREGRALQRQEFDEPRLPGFRLLRCVEFDEELDEMAEKQGTIALTGHAELDLLISQSKKGNLFVEQSKNSILHPTLLDRHADNRHPALLRLLQNSIEFQEKRLVHRRQIDSSRWVACSQRRQRIEHQNRRRHSDTLPKQRA